jgi:hypothetical protein
MAGPDEARSTSAEPAAAQTSHLARIQKTKRKGPANLTRPFPENAFDHRLFALALLARFLALTARILLLLSRLLAAALLLARLLSGVLILLAGILVLTGHCDLPCSSRKGNNRGTRAWLHRTWFFVSGFLQRFPHHVGPAAENYLCTSS